MEGTELPSLPCVVPGLLEEREPRPSWWQRMTVPSVGSFASLAAVPERQGRETSSLDGMPCYLCTWH